MTDLRPLQRMRLPQCVMCHRKMLVGHSPEWLVYMCGACYRRYLIVAHPKPDPALVKMRADAQRHLERMLLRFHWGMSILMLFSALVFFWILWKRWTN